MTGSADKRDERSNVARVNQGKRWIRSKKYRKRWTKKAIEEHRDRARTEQEKLID
jgi:hypothetical protein